MKQLTTYLPDHESVNAYVRAAVEAENRRRMFAGMDEAIAAATDPTRSARGTPRTPRSSSPAPMPRRGEVWRRGDVAAYVVGR